MRKIFIILLILGACKPAQAPKKVSIKPIEVLFREGGLIGENYKASVRIINPNNIAIKQQKIYLRYFDKQHKVFIKQDSIVTEIAANQFKIVSFNTADCKKCEWLEIAVQSKK